MLPWVQVYSSLREHHKIDDLADELKLRTRYEAIGLVVSLWLWAVNNALDGDISKYRPRAIAEAVGWKGRPEALLEGLVQAGFLDAGEESLVIHDWDEYTALYAIKEETRMEKNRRRVAEYRKRKKGITVTECNGDGNADVTVTGNVTVTECNALPNITLPIHNINSINREEDNNPLPGAEALQAPSLPPPEESQFERFQSAWSIISHDGMEEAKEAWNECISSRQDAERAIFRVGPYWYACSGGTAKKVSAAEWLRKGGWK